jgi:hypothetical protein
VYPPLSTVTCGGKIYDVALKKSPGLIACKDGRYVSPTFKADWKSKDEAMVWERFGWPKNIFFDRDMRVHTAMDPTRRRAKDEALFAIRRIIPDGMEWIGRIDLDQVPERDQPKVASQLKAILESGLIGLGKTKVRADVSVEDAKLRTNSTFSPVVDADGKRKWIVALQTPAVMADPKPLTPESSSRALQLKATYDRYWKDISKSNLALSHYFAHQSMKGRYLFYHFQKKRQVDYYPFFLTESGSVFVLEEKGGDAQSLIKDWAEQGLPLPAWAKSAYGDHWEHCPWLRENGFGEITVNLQEHISNCPQNGVWKEV